MYRQMYGQFVVRMIDELEISLHRDLYGFSMKNKAIRFALYKERANLYS